MALYIFCSLLPFLHFWCSNISLPPTRIATRTGWCIWKYHYMYIKVKVKVKVSYRKVCLYSLDIPTGSADFTLIAPRYWYSIVSSSWGECRAIFCSCSHSHHTWSPSQLGRQRQCGFKAFHTWLPESNPRPLDLWSNPFTWPLIRLISLRVNCLSFWQWSYPYYTTYHIVSF